MGLFERLGEKVEQAKQEAVTARDEDIEYRCGDCDKGFYNEQETCPACGSTEIDRVSGDTAAEN